jgi:hypothetical protein
VKNTALSSIHELEEEVVASQDGRRMKIMAGAAEAEWVGLAQAGMVLRLDGVAIQAAVEAFPEEEDLEACLVKR